MPLAPTGSRDGYHAEWTPTEPGDYTIRLEARTAAGDLLGHDEIALSVGAESTETDDLPRNDRLLAEIAKASGGQAIDLPHLHGLLDDLIRARRSQAQLHARDDADPPGRIRLYHFPILFGLFVAFLTTEWILRRSWQLQ